MKNVPRILAFAAVLALTVLPLALGVRDRLEGDVARAEATVLPGADRLLRQRAERPDEGCDPISPAPARGAQDDGAKPKTAALSPPPRWE